MEGVRLAVVCSLSYTPNQSCRMLTDDSSEDDDSSDDDDNDSDDDSSSDDEAPGLVSELLQSV